MGKSRKNIFYSVVINTIFIVVFFLLFEPSAKSDDYDMTNILYGGMNGQYSPFIMYSNYIWGRILVFLMELFPTVSWFFLSQYLLMYSANIFIGYIAINDNKCKMPLFIVYLFVFSYEFYMRITFSKTAGFLIFSGLFFILYYIERNKNKLVFIIGVFYIFVGLLIRNSFYMLMLVIMFPTFINYLICADKREMKRGISCFIIVVVIGYILSWGLKTYNVNIYKNDELWNQYLENNSVRASLIDFGIPNYEEYKEEYQAIGVSENDYKLWFSYNFRCDEDRLDDEMYHNIVNIRVINRPPLIERIITYTRGIVDYVFSNIVSVFFVLFLSFAVLSKMHKKKLKILLIVVFGFIPYYYLSLIGRMQHHVDVVIFISLILLLLYYIEDFEWNSRAIILSIIIFSVISSRFYRDISSNSYYGDAYGCILSEKETRQDNYNMMKSISQDKDHIYIIPPLETNRIYPCFCVDEVIEKNFYDNIFIANSNHIPIAKQILNNYEITNLWNEATDSEVIRFAFSDSTIEQLESVTKYINENYNKNAIYELVDKVDNLYIYRFVSE